MKRRGVTLVIGLVILVALACNAPAPKPASPTESPSTEQPPTSSPVEKPTGTPAPAPGDKWKVYTHNEAGFSLEYPGHWDLETTRTSAPLEGWSVTEPGFAVYTNFIGGFEEFEPLETRAVTLTSGENVEMEVYAKLKYVSEDEIERTSERLVLVQVPTLGPSGLMMYSFDRATEPEGLAVIERILATFEVRKSESGAEVGAAWQTYSNADHRLSFQYPTVWGIREAFVPETAGGVEGNVLTIILGRMGGDNANDWIRINPWQFHRKVGTCREVDEHSICTYSENQALIDVLDRSCSTFEM
jgi:hypothetical protein